MRQRRQTNDEPTAPPTETGPPPTFDLITEPWIPIIRCDGTETEVGLKEALTAAHEIRAIHDPMPPVEFGLYRLLTALVGDIFAPEGRPWDTEDLANLLDAGRFDPDRIADYFDKWRDRFDLFHPVRPFLQTVFDDEDENLKPVAQMIFPLSRTHNRRFFSHLDPDSIGIAPAVAARQLPQIGFFALPGGSGYFKGINGVPPWYVVLNFDCLFTDLCINYCVVPLPTDGYNAPPAWRSDEQVVWARKDSVSLLSGLTWQPRRIHLHPGIGGICSMTGQTHPLLIRTMHYSRGFGPGEGFNWTDPNCAYHERLGKNPDGQSLVITEPLAPTSGREPWRDVCALVMLSSETKYLRPRIVDQFERMVQDEYFDIGDRTLGLKVYSAIADQASMKEWFKDELALAAEIIWNHSSHHTAITEMTRAEQVASALKSAIVSTHSSKSQARKRSNKQTGDKILKALVEKWQREFWAVLRTPYFTLLEQIAPLNPEDDADRIADSLRAWRDRVRLEGWQALGAAIDDLDTDADAIERLVNARAAFAKKLKKILEA